MIKKSSILALLILAAVGLQASAQNFVEGIDSDAIIERILVADAQRTQFLKDVVYEAEWVEGEEKDGQFKEKIRFRKKVYVKYLKDTALLAEEYLAYYKDGEKKSDKDLRNEAKDRLKKKRKRKARDISFPMLEPFYPEKRSDYKIEYLGVASDSIDSYVCHHFRVSSLIEDEQHINGDFYFEAETFNVVLVNFTPAKLVKRTMFKISKLDLSVHFAPGVDGLWLPRQFDIDMKGKAAFVFGVRVRGTEYYRNPIINGGIDDAMFEVSDDD